jgi:hypothetical protein
MGKISTAGVPSATLGTGSSDAAPQVVSRDKSVRRSAQDDDFGGILTKNIELRNAPERSTQFLLVNFRAVLYRNGGQRGRPGVLPWRAAHHAAEGFTEGAFGLVAERLRDDGAAGALCVHRPRRHRPWLSRGRSLQATDQQWTGRARRPGIARIRDRSTALANARRLTRLFRPC